MCIGVKSDILKPAKGGWIICPSCSKKLLRALPDTEAANLPVWCTRCRREYIAEIHPQRPERKTPESRILR